MNLLLFSLFTLRSVGGRCVTLDVEHWWNDTDGDTGVLDKNLFPSIRKNSVLYLGIYTAFRTENNKGFEISTVVEMHYSLSRPTHRTAI
jgi:hypothetical protein